MLYLHGSPVEPQRRTLVYVCICVCACICVCICMYTWFPSRGLLKEDPVCAIIFNQCVCVIRTLVEHNGILAELVY